MHFITYDQVVAATLHWERQLPEFDAFVGVPRGGVIPASILAMQRNVRLIGLQTLLEHPGTALANTPVNYHESPADNPPRGSRVLIVDDNVGPTASTAKRLREQLRDSPLDISYAVLYFTIKSPEIEHWGFYTPRLPIFEYDWHRRTYLDHVAVDLDGVLCQDYALPEKEGSDPVHEKHVREARPWLRLTRPVKAIVTGRLAKHRQATEEWLARHGYRYGELVMYPGDSADERRRRGDPWRHKAEYLKNNPVWFFVESDPIQARNIMEFARKPVFCTATRQMIHPR